MYDFQPADSANIPARDACPTPPWLHVAVVRGQQVKPMATPPGFSAHNAIRFTAFPVRREFCKIFYGITLDLKVIFLKKAHVQ